MNEKKAILLMIFILHDGTTSRLLPPTHAIVNTTRPEDKFPLEKTFLGHGSAIEGKFDDMPTFAMNDLQNNHDGSERVQALRRLAKRHLDPKYLRHGDAISLKYTAMRTEWLSCWGSGYWCELRSCPGTNNPSHSCRGEVFWIYGRGRHPNQKILTCDTVGLQYSFMRGSHYWLSEDENHQGYYYKTRTCPGDGFEFGYGWSGCPREKFVIRVEGKGCGENVEDRDDIQLQAENNFYVAGYYGYRWIYATHTEPSPWKLYIL
ncbi:hypothetical protein DPMN_054790 [Dreissena polymorpha]|uniref:Uncharacterized protein n=1 Tax=Dreissena polymorpha TaxID=45954 RepID=A0A9D4CR22_DREPO|nr:hypothetical protein DPMN_054790 [Dreissena polymorpha]